MCVFLLLCHGRPLAWVNCPCRVCAMPAGKCRATGHPRGIRRLRRGVQGVLPGCVTDPHLCGQRCLCRVVHSMHGDPPLVWCAAPPPPHTPPFHHPCRSRHAASQRCCSVPLGHDPVLPRVSTGHSGTQHNRATCHCITGLLQHGCRNRAGQRQHLVGQGSNTWRISGRGRGGECDGRGRLGYPQ
jgi:hypothetical protein